jgi:hypothetical protein
MSIQSKLENSSFNIKRKLFDNSIKLHGIEVKGIRVFEDINKYGDTTNIEITKDDEITGYIDLLSVEIPTNRYRLDATDSKIDNQSIFLFEILPIDFYTKWSDEIEKGDLLVLILKDKVADLDIPILFRVSESLGRFQKNLLFRKYNIAPYNPSVLDQTIRQIILDYISEN